MGVSIERSNKMTDMPDKDSTRSIEDQEYECALEIFEVVKRYPVGISVSAVSNLLMSMIVTIADKEREEQFKRMRSN